MKLLKVFALTGVLSLALVSSAFADVQLTILNGHVSLVARDATVRQILAEWAKVGQTKVVNADRIPGGPVTLEFQNLSEDQALDVLLRSISGYMAAPRAVPVANASRFDRIIVMPTSVAPRAASATPPPFSQAGVQPSPFVPPQVPADDDDDDDRPAPNVPVPPPGRGPVFNTFPQPQVVNPPQQGVPAAIPGMIGAPPQTQPQVGAPATYPPTGAPGAQPAAPSGGVAVPGMIVQPPQPVPGQPVQPGQPIQQRRPGGQ